MMMITVVSGGSSMVFSRRRRGLVDDVEVDEDQSPGTGPPAA